MLKIVMMCCCYFVCFNNMLKQTNTSCLNATKAMPERFARGFDGFQNIKMLFLRWPKIHVGVGASSWFSHVLQRCVDFRSA